MKKLIEYAPDLAIATIAMILFGCAISLSVSGASGADAMAEENAATDDAATNNELDIGFALGEGAGDRFIKEAAAGRYFLMPGLPLNSPAPPSSAPIVAIIDFASLRNHPQLKGVIVGEKDFTGEGPEDRTGHGTFAALTELASASEGLKAATELGVPAATALAGVSTHPILSAKVLDKKNQCKEKNVMAAIRWAVSAGAQIINLSLGFLGSKAKYRDLCNAISSFKDTLFVAAAGNYGPDVPVYPAACSLDNLIPVGALNESGKPMDESGKGSVYAKGETILVAPAYYFLEEGNRLAKAGKTSEAKSAYLQGLTDEDLPELHFQLGSLGLQENRTDEALAEFQRVKALNPGFKDIDKMIEAASDKTAH